MKWQTGTGGPVGLWVHERCGGWGVPEVPFAYIALSEGCEIVAAALFHTYQPGRDVHMTVAVERPSFALVAGIRHCVRYARQTLGVPRITAEIDLGNVKSVRLAEGIGFELEGRKRRAGDGGKDVGVFGLVLEEGDRVEYENAIRA